MKKMALSTLVLFLTITTAFVSCSKKKDAPDDPKKSSRLVRYEITGNYTGKLNILTTTNTAAMVSYNDISVPWTKEITYPDNVMGVGIGGNSSATAGVVGQTITLKVFSGDNLIYTKSATADANGVLGLPTYAFVFQ